MMDFDKLRSENKKKERIFIAKSRLRTYGKDLMIKEGVEAKISILEDSLSIGASWSSPDATKGGGIKQEDRMVSVFDDIDKLKRTLLQIDLDTRAIAFAIKGLSKEEMFIVKNMWMAESKAEAMSFQEVADRLHYSKTSVTRMSDRALLYTYKRLYLIEGPDVDVR